ncbi:hypothetical protein VE01_02721 [Pseudogymnoascus verrucosus]|uniref:ENTH domain-containing protein n=1 Tax=Pseudogymnoascus verrucosus TaxID=342668 RepID=A0A1B8GTV1_9PEZI|nr:uncharacterized protein VE01_02721 [Pseudogymnoascus verrucosus]OBT99245.1 hypothetical protein VE01_02721 [Pseudogymnoascus verrucosus]
MSKVMRSVKNVTKGYSSVQVKVRNATSNDPWGPTGTEMQEISQMTYNSSTEFYEIMYMIDKRLNDKGKNWRHVLKALKVLDYCLHEGSEMVVTWARKNVFIIKTLREFQHIDDDGRDVGQNVRVSAKELTSLILDEERLRAERSDRKSWKSRVTGIEEYGSSETSPPPRHERPHRAQRADEEDAEYKLAIEASKHQEEEDRKKRQSRQGEPDDDDLAKAIKLSKEEEDLRLKELEDANAQSLFDDDPVQMQGNQPQFTGYNQGYQQQGAVDWSGNPIDMSQGQQPNYLNAYATGYPQAAPQQTGYQTGYQNGFPSFEQYVQQQTAQTSPFPSSQNYNPYAQQPQQQQQQAEPIVPANTNNPWATSAQTAVQAQAPAPTGSNNPFATSRPAPAQTSSQPTLSTLQEQKTLSSFNNQSQFSQPSSFTPPPQQQQQHLQPQLQQPQKSQSPYEARLASLLESGDGMDTFGNTGNLRIPAQHTAPGTFVNSAGAGLPGLNAQQTGVNPFIQGQFTGMPQAQYGGQQGYGGGGQQGMQHAQTGAGNPFGRQQGAGGGNLIDF